MEPAVIVLGGSAGGLEPLADILALFRSAAVAHRNRMIGIVLSGMLYDGSRGLLAIKRCGGVAVVQEPSDAEHPQMPCSALASVEAD